MQPKKRSRGRLGATLALTFTLSGLQAATPAEEYFETHIRPVLIRSCYGCHTRGQAGGLRLDSRDALIKGGAHGPAIVPGAPESSLLLRALHYRDELKMPPPGQLAATEIRAFEQWIRDGAPWPASATTTRGRTVGERERNFWSYRKVVKPVLPEVAARNWPRGEIDRFTLARMEQKKLKPGPDADKLTLIRRVTFGLTGLPPTPEQIQQFLDDASPAAYEALIDRLLASRAYAERWGRFWLDVVRYADTAGNGADYPVPDAHKYRDWVIEAWAEDKPYDQFIREQLAGDLLPAKSEPEHWKQTIATGYLAIARRGDAGMNGVVADAVDNLGYAFLGTSLACARCHDHKFDPIPTRDYYAIYGILNSTRFAQPGSEPVRWERDFVYRDPKATQSQEYLDFQAQLAPVAKAIEAVHRLPYFDDILPALEARRMDLYKKEPKFERAYAVADGPAGDAAVLLNGDPKTPTEEVPRGFLQVLGGQQLPASEKGSGRLQLANWIASGDNPLTARVFVNRVWQGHFGKGLVPTPNDFGTRGMAPSHPELLDYLASRFVEGGWSVKRLHREILLSRTYRLATGGDAQSVKLDPDNVYLSRQNRRRLDAEQLRDAMLAVSGTLDTTAAGAHPFPAPSEWNYSGHVPFEAVYPTNRRSVYLMTQRIRQHPYLGLFDAPDPNNSTAQRTANATSLQALFFMNGELPAKSAQALASVLVKEYPSPEVQTDRLFRLILNRPATVWEMELTRTFREQAVARFTTQGDSLTLAQRKVTAALAEAMFATNEFLYLE